MAPIVIEGVKPINLVASRMAATRRCCLKTGGGGPLYTMAGEMEHKSHRKMDLQADTECQGMGE